MRTSQKSTQPSLGAKVVMGTVKSPAERIQEVQGSGQWQLTYWARKRERAEKESEQKNLVTLVCWVYLGITYYTIEPVQIVNVLRFQVLMMIR